MLHIYDTHISYIFQTHSVKICYWPPKYIYICQICSPEFCSRNYVRSRLQAYCQFLTSHPGAKKQYLWKMLYLQILETLPSNPGQHREHLPHPRVKHKKAVMGIRGVGPPPPPSSKPAKAQTGGTRMKAPHLKELCSVCALFKSQSGR